MRGGGPAAGRADMDVDVSPAARADAVLANQGRRAALPEQAVDRRRCGGGRTEQVGGVRGAARRHGKRDRSVRGSRGRAHRSRLRIGTRDSLVKQLVVASGPPGGGRWERPSVRQHTVGNPCGTGFHPPD